MTVAIAYSSGCYGTYVEWCLTSLTSTAPVVSPFTQIGNSHQFIGRHLYNLDGWRLLLALNDQPSFVRLHPKQHPTISLSKNLDYLCETAKSVVYLYPDREYLLLVLNNWITKTTFHSYKVLLHSLGLAAKDTEISSSSPQWLQRKFLSVHFISWVFEILEWYHLDHWSHPNACVVTVKELLFDFENCLNKIQQHCNLKFLRSPNELQSYHDQNLQLQQYLHQDQLCNNIVESVLTGDSFSWPGLPLMSEAWLQWQLRNLGFEIQGDGLDNLPTNSLQLRELLYTV
jgi:hypothetical protein